MSYRKVTIELNLGNDAFNSVEDIQICLKNAISRLYRTNITLEQSKIKMLDENGNSVGFLRIEEVNDEK